MTDVATDEAQEPTGLSAADQQLLRELTERARGRGHAYQAVFALCYGPRS